MSSTKTFTAQLTFAGIEWGQLVRERGSGQTVGLGWGWGWAVREWKQG